MLDLAMEVVFLTDMTVLDEKIQQLMEKRDGRFHCKACDYTSSKSINMKDHVDYPTLASYVIKHTGIKENT